MYQLISIDQNTWAYQDRMPDGDTVRFFVLDGSEGCLVIDSGYMDIDVYGMVRDLLQKNGRAETTAGEPKPVYLANTHGDGDHTSGNASFPFYYITRTDHEVMGLQNRFPDTEWIPAEEGTTIELGNRTLTYFMAPGHTLGNAVILDVTNRILFPGDIIQTGTMFMFGAHRSPAQMAESLKKLRGMKDRFDTIYACHGQAVLPADAVDEIITAWDKVLEGAVQPTPAIAFDAVEVDLYDCGFCRFYCNKGSVIPEA